MDKEHDHVGGGEVSDFDREATREQTGVLREFMDYMGSNKKWWLTPILVALLLVGILAILVSNPVTAPFIYTLF